LQQAEQLPGASRRVLLDLGADELIAAVGRVLDESGVPAYRLRQLQDWIYARPAEGFASMSDLPKALRARLAESFLLHPLSLERESISQDGTRKFLWSRHHPGLRAPAAGKKRGTIESVLIPDRERVTYCLSTQAGCPVKCPFCATGYGGFEGQLSAGEIIDQVLLMRSHSALPPTNLVFMGMGEPLLNFDAVAKALEILTEPRQLHCGARRITVSTVGIPDRIRELGERFPQVKLAVSLHAARNELRDELVPLNRRFPLEAVLAAVREHTRSTGRMVTFEYVVLPSVNDTRRDVEEIGRLLDGIPSRLNLIGFNPFPGGPYRKPELRRLLCFRDWLQRVYRGPITLRRSRGEDIQGACGQLSLEERSVASAP
jgi:23S rRNA (adenine2503-C2)-methyltransferase